MAFGISFGKNKEKIDKTSTVNKLETGSQTGSQTTAGTKTNTGTVDTSGTSTSVGQSQTNQTGQTTNTGTGTQTQTQTSQLFDDTVLADLQSSVGQLLGDAFGAGRSAVQAGAAGLSGFDADEFVSGGMAQATSRVNSSLDEALGSMFSAIGGTSGTNSAAALLEQRMTTQAADELAGTRSNLTAQGQQILRDNLATQSGVQTADNQFLASLLDSLKGGVATTTGDVATTTTEAGTSQQAGTTNTMEQQAQQQQQQTQAVESLIETLNSLLNTTTQTTGTEHVKGKTSKSGGGFGLSL